MSAANRLLIDHPEGTAVPRQELVAVVGKFQLMASLVRGGQNILAPICRARDALADPSARDGGARAAWSSDVGITPGAAPRTEVASTAAIGRTARSAGGQASTAAIGRTAQSAGGQASTAAIGRTSRSAGGQASTAAIG
ncbi:hypothetical protein CYMTET_28188, partial [Cymbomonas tetramitiformis]